MSSRAARIARTAGGSLLTAVLGCGPAVDAAGASEGGTEAEAETETEGEGEPQVVWLSDSKAVDILFVLDDTATMDEEQHALSKSLPSFVSALEADGGGDYRIGVTSTDNGNPWCETTPERGNLVISSCWSRIDDFIWGGPLDDPPPHVCAVHCPETWESIEIQPTTTHHDPQPRPRPWVQSIGGQTNLPAGLDVATALQCILPQGIQGCGHEQPLESMYKALRRASKDDEDEYDFVRDEAVLAIVFVTDEVDCSYTPVHESIFLADGMRTFWSLPEEEWPTSALCWNAGVQCHGGPGTYDTCESAEYDVTGAPALDDDAAVLRPVRRYIERLASIENDKRSFDGRREVIVAGIVGVPTDYAQTGQVLYQDAPGGSPNDPNYQDNYGIGPGCLSTTAEAVPPVRLREVAEAFRIGEQPSLFSVCDEDYAPALEAIAEQVRRQLGPTCMTACVADTDPSTDRLDASCSLRQVWSVQGEEVEVEVPACEAGDALPEGQEVCYVALSGDARSAECVEAGFNLEFRIVRRDGAGPPAGARIAAQCELSQDAAADCPDVP